MTCRSVSAMPRGKADLEEGMVSRTCLHHHLRRRAVDILLKACKHHVRIPRHASEGIAGFAYPPTT